MSSHPYSQELLPDDAGPSWQSRCINGLLRLLPIKAQTASAAAVHKDTCANWHCGRRPAPE
jgi:hypothetical protein